MFSAFYFNLIYFILSDFISYCSCYYAFCLCVVWDVYVSSSNFAFFLFLLMIYILYSHCLFILRIIFLLSLLLISSLSSSQSFYFFNTTGHWGRIQQMNSSGMVYPYPLVTLGSRRVSIIFYFYSITIIINFFCKLYFGDRCWGVDALFHIYHMTSFNYDAKETKDVCRSCRCHLSSSQMPV